MTNGEIAFVDGIRQAAREIFAEGADSLHDSVQGMMELMVIVTVRTPFPEPREGFFFGAPTNEPWVALYGYYTDVVLPITLLVVGLAVAMILFTGIFGTFLTGYERSRAKRRLVVAFLFVLAWWGIGSFLLRFVDALAIAIAPETEAVATVLQDSMALEGHSTVVTTVIAMFEGLTMLLLVTSFFVRWIGVYALMLATPIGISFWIVDVGPFAYLSALIEELIIKFIPLAFITIPAAVVFRVAELLFGAFDPSTQFGTGVGPFLLALGFPWMVIIVSYYIFFKVPTFREITAQMSYAPSGDEDRQTVEKGRGQDQGGTPERGAVYTGREGKTGGDGRTGGRGGRGGSPTPTRGTPTTTGSDRFRRPVRNYETESTGTGAAPGAGTPAGAGGPGHSLDRSRRKLSDLRRWG